MIQRPQSILLLLVIVALLTTTRLPMWSKQERDSPYAAAKVTYVISTWSFAAHVQGSPVRRTYFPYGLVGGLSLLVAGFATYALCSYENRAKQLKIGLLNSVVMGVMLGVLLCLILQKDRCLLPALCGNYRAGLGFFVMALVCNLWANVLIRKDERLVQAADRIR